MRILIETFAAIRFTLPFCTSWMSSVWPKQLHQFRHSKIHQASFATPNGLITVADFRRVEDKFPYIMMLPQAQFLEFITAEAKHYPNFRLLMGASAQELIEDEGEVHGVRYRASRRLARGARALTVGTDGRSSRIRKLANVELTKSSPPMDVLWFRIPRQPKDPEGVLAHFGQGHALVMLDRLDEWQIAYVILKGSYSEVQAAGLDAFRKSVAELMIEFPDRIQHLKEWKQIAVLSVESSRVNRWYKPGLL